MTYEIKLPQFEGPFDLILFFIERDELDIYNIPVAKITDDFLAYINQMESLNIELASEFILVAATLMRIKAKMLLPRKELNEDGEEIDPREELIRKLLEYKKFKAIIGDLKEMEKTRSQMHKRGGISNDLLEVYNNYTTEMELESVSLFKLLKVFSKVLDRYEDRSKKVEHMVLKFPYTIAEQKTLMVDLINKQGRVSFEEAYASCEHRMEAIYRFLAMLELIALKVLAITVGLGVNNFWLSINSESGNINE